MMTNVPRIFMLLFSFWISATLHATMQNLQNEPPVVISFSNQPFNLDGSFPYHVEEVFLGQQETQVLGFISEGHVPIQFESSITAELKAFFQSQFPVEKEKMPIIVRVNRLSVLAFENVLRTNVSLSFFVRQDNKIVLLHNVSALRTSNISIFEKSTKTFSRNLMLTFQSCFQELSDRYKKKTLVQREVSEIELKRIQIDALNFPILDNHSPVKGVFYSYGEFMDYLIDTTAVFKMIQHMPSDSLIKKAKFKNLKKKSVWGVCDGTHYYVRNKKNFHRMTYNPKKKHFEICFRTKDLSDSGGDFATAFFFGFAGLGIKKMLESLSSEDIILPLDLPTGMVYSLPKLKKEVIIECIGKGESVAISIENSDGKICDLKKGEFFRYRPSSLDGIVRILLKSAAFEREIIFDPMNEQRILIEHKPHKIAVEFAPFVDPYALQTHLRKNRTEVGKQTTNQH